MQVATELEAYRRITTSPEISLVRGSLDMKQEWTDDTYDRREKLLLRMLRFLQWDMKLPGEQLSLALLINQVSFLRCVSFLVWRCDGNPAEAYKAIQACIGYLKWHLWNLKQGKSGREHINTCESAISMYSMLMPETLRKSHSYRAAKRMVSHDAGADNSLPSPEDVIMWQEEIKLDALRQGRADLALYKTYLRSSTALLVRDASMLCTAFGHSSLAGRPSNLCTPKTSDASNGACNNRSCQVPGCKGNTFKKFIAGSSDGTECSPTHYELHLTHHKTSSRGVGPMVLTFDDPGVVELLHMYEEYARPVILNGPRCRANPKAPTGSRAAPAARQALKSRDPTGATRRAVSDDDTTDDDDDDIMDFDYDPSSESTYVAP